ncbi:unnamed protein product, partial [Brugia pahangi]|uniref:Palmitoyltransferase n=1 Tax=Brugia pahangi TaxID=6280 RepID=A0A0N4TD78_BRUPA
NKVIKIYIIKSITKDYVLYCYQCSLIKPDRCHHCSSCGYCVVKYDHHCPWINKCVSFNNYKYFMLYLIYSCILLAWFVISLFFKFIINYFNIFLYYKKKSKKKKVLKVI